MRGYLALGGCHLCKQGLGHFGPLHLLLDLIVDGGVDVEDAAVRLAVPLAGQRRRFNLLAKTTEADLEASRFFIKI